MIFDPELNNARVDAAYRAVLIGEIFQVKDKLDQAVLPTDNRLIAIFNGPIDQFVGGRILTLQQAVFDECGAYSEILRAVPSCLKVFFRLDIPNEKTRRDLIPFFESEEFSALCKEIDVGYVQYSGDIFPKLRA